jgi:hypothetical protein
MTTLSDYEDSLPERVSRLATEGESYEVEFKGESRTPLNNRDLVERVLRK